MTEQAGIYIITNTANGKMYVGSASNISKRLSRHKKDLRAGKHPNSHLLASWVKYGESAFAFGVLELCDKDQLTEREQFWIDKLSPQYNMCPVARSSRGRPVTDAMREHGKFLAKSLTSEHRKKAQETRKASGCYRLTQEDAEAIRKEYGEWKPGGKGRSRNLPSMASLAKKYNVHIMTIQNVLSGKTWL